MALSQLRLNLEGGVLGIIVQLLHLQDLSNDSVNADCPIIWCIVLHLPD